MVQSPCQSVLRIHIVTRSRCVHTTSLGLGRSLAPSRRLSPWNPLLDLHSPRYEAPRQSFLHGCSSGACPDTHHALGILVIHTSWKTPSCFQGDERMLSPLVNAVCHIDRRGAGAAVQATKAERVPKIWDNVSAENLGREWSARFHSCLLQGLELTAALVHCNPATGFILAAWGRRWREG